VCFGEKNILIPSLSNLKVLSASKYYKICLFFFTKAPIKLEENLPFVEDIDQDYYSYYYDNYLENEEILTSASPLPHLNFQVSNFSNGWKAETTQKPKMSEMLTSCSTATENPAMKTPLKISYNVTSNPISVVGYPTFL